MNESENMDTNLDIEITRMREHNYEKFKSLVRMHLSFELDLNTDEFDHECHEVFYEDKGKPKKWVSKKQKLHLATAISGTSCTSGGGDRSPPPEKSCYMHLHLPEFQKFFLLEKNLTQEGIFRKTGSAGRQNELRVRLKSDQKFDMEESGFSVHDCATVFKGYLADLPEPLLTEAHYPAYSQLASLCIGGGAIAIPKTANQPNSERFKREQQVLNSLQLLLLLLPIENRNLLKEIIIILHAVVDYEDFNKMTADNLATLFAPHLICPRNMPPEALHYVAKKMSNVIAFMIMRGVEIFEVPVKLATDIKAYFLERKRKTTMSPEALDDSISDISTVNTVYTFVDREKTAAAHITNTTDTELAQLYAHIQSLPESSKKRRLIKQFNKQNGQGTPLQFVVMNRLKSEGSRSVKSFSNSIKKHIFQKGLISRTPKRVPPTNSTTSRALFQSPATPCITTTTTTYTDSDSDACPTPHNNSYKQLQRATQSIASTPIHWNSSHATPLTQRNIDIHDLLYTQTFQRHAHVESKPSSTITSKSLATATSLNVISETTTIPSILLNNNMMCEEAGEDSASVSTDDLEHDATEMQTSSSNSQIEISKSRYKSEPNLSCLSKERPAVPSTINELMTPTNKNGKSLTHKLIKGVSMSNLKLPFGTPETTKRLMRSVSSTLKLRQHTTTTEHSDTERLMSVTLETSAENTPVIEEVNNSDSNSPSSTEVDFDSTNGGGADANGSGSTAVSTNNTKGRHNSKRQQLLRGHNLNGITTSTPSWLLGRRSMSPITKSTQRMSKAMQESIMTPRSRKPVIMFTTTTTLNSTDQSQTPYNADSDASAVFAEKDEENFLNRQQQQQQQQHEQQEQWQQHHQEKCTAADCRNGCMDFNIEQNEMEPNALSSDFKEYLLSRSVLTASLVDSSFSSQSDDFGSTKELVCLDESELSQSLLYCLDGNEPQKTDATLDCDTKSKLVLVETTQNQNYLKDNGGDYPHSNSGRKRAACRKLSEDERFVNGNDRDLIENQENSNEHIAITKKLLISNPVHPGETSL